MNPLSTSENPLQELFGKLKNEGIDLTPEFEGSISRTEKTFVSTYTKKQFNERIFHIIYFLKGNPETPIDEILDFCIDLCVVKNTKGNIDRILSHEGNNLNQLTLQLFQSYKKQSKRKKTQTEKKNSDTTPPPSQKDRRIAKIAPHEPNGEFETWIAEKYPTYGKAHVQFYHMFHNRDSTNEKPEWTKDIDTLYTTVYIGKNYHDLFGQGLGRLRESGVTDSGLEGYITAYHQDNPAHINDDGVRFKVLEKLFDFIHSVDSVISRKKSTESDRTKDPDNGEYEDDGDIYEKGL